MHRVLLSLFESGQELGVFLVISNVGYELSVGNPSRVGFSVLDTIAENSSTVSLTSPADMEVVSADRDFGSRDESWK